MSCQVDNIQKLEQKYLYSKLISFEFRVRVFRVRKALFHQSTYWKLEAVEVRNLDGQIRQISPYTFFLKKNENLIFVH